MTDIVQRLRDTIVNETPARYPEIASAAADEIEQLRAALQQAFVAMRIAAALPGVAAEYDFGTAITKAQSVLYGKLAPQGQKQHTNNMDEEWVAEIKRLRGDIKFQVELEREACAQVALCLDEDAGVAIAAGIRARTSEPQNH